MNHRLVFCIIAFMAFLSSLYGQELLHEREKAILFKNPPLLFNLFHEPQDLADSLRSDTVILERVKETEHIYNPYYPYVAIDTQTTFFYKVELIYRSGVKVRARAYYQNGKLAKETHFNAFGKNGTIRRWYPNGSIYSYALYKNDKLASPSLTYYENGAPWRLIMDTTINGLWTLTWYENGQPYVITTKMEDSKAFLSKRYYENGQIMDSLENSSGRKNYVSYYWNGLKESEGDFLNSKLQKLGKWHYWHENGQLAAEKTYDENVINFNVGTWKYWDEQGNLIKEEFYQEGKLVDVKECIAKPEKR